jgi:hypothetical protein
MVVLPCTGALHYHNCCIDGGTSPEYFGYTLVHDVQVFSVFIAVFVHMMAFYREKYGLLCSVKDDLGLNHQTYRVSSINDAKCILHNLFTPLRPRLINTTATSDFTTWRSQPRWNTVLPLPIQHVHHRQKIHAQCKHHSDV